MANPIPPMRFVWWIRLSLIGVVLCTAIAVSVPAYSLIRTTLDRQAYTSIATAERTALALTEAQFAALRLQAELISERPTLRQLVRSNNLVGLQAYLRTFQGRTTLDAIAICLPDWQALLPDGQTLCSAASMAEGIVQLDDNRIAAITQNTAEVGPDGRLVVVVTAFWLDAAYLDGLSTIAGMQFGLFTTTGAPIVSEVALAGSQLNDENANQIVRAITPTGDRYYGRTPFSVIPSAVPLVLETTLPVEAVRAIERQTLLALISTTTVGVVLVTLFGVLGARALVLPLARLTEAAKRISRGQINTPIPTVHGPSEVTELASALQKSHAALVQSMAEQAQSAEWLERLIQSLNEGVVTFTPAGKITFFSLGAENILEIAAEQAINQQIESVMALADEQAGSLRSLLPDGDEHCTLNLRTAKGQIRTVHLTGAQLVPPHGTGLNFALVLRDVTDEAAVSRLRAYFLANISHELRTPLSALAASMEMLLDEGEELSPTEMRELLKPSHLSLVILQTLVDNLLESSRIQAGYFVTQPRPIFLDGILNDALQIMKPLLDRRNQYIVVDSPTITRRISADPTRIVQVLVNLLANASKFSPPGGQIKIAVQPQPNVLRLLITDSGPGIETNDPMELFHPFIHATVENSQHYGVGLGLHVVQTIINAHGGQVGAYNENQTGATFWFELPYAELMENGLEHTAG